MLAALGKMTDANQKEMLAGLFLSKFNTKESKAGTTGDSPRLTQKRHRKWQIPPECAICVGRFG